MLAAKNATEEDIQALEEIYRTMLNSFNDLSAKISVYAFSDKKFHERLAEATHNEFLIQIYRTVSNIYKTYIDQTCSELSGRKASALEHGEILEAIKKHDSAAAELAMRSHISMACKLYLQGIDLKETQ